MKKLLGILVLGLIIILQIVGQQAHDRHMTGTWRDKINLVAYLIISKHNIHVNIN
jgi:hypothetical protein